MLDSLRGCRQIECHLGKTAIFKEGVMYLAKNAEVKEQVLTKVEGKQLKGEAMPISSKYLMIASYR